MSSWAAARAGAPMSLNGMPLAPARYVAPVQALGVGEGERRAPAPLVAERRQEGGGGAGHRRPAAVGHLREDRTGPRPRQTGGRRAVQQGAAADARIHRCAQEYFTVQP